MFNVGDRVRVKRDDGLAGSLKVGTVGTVINLGGPGVDVKFDNYALGWGKSRRCWFVVNDNLELVLSGTPIEIAYSTRPVVAEWWNEYIYEYKWLSEYKSSIYLSRHPLIHVNPATIKEG